MLQDFLKGKKLILASASPRRQELLKGLDYPFEIDTKNNFIEEYPNDIPLNDIPLFLAKGKSYGFHRELQEDEILITADTMVLCEGKILGKPHNSDEARKMLQLLSGRKHTVITGVYLRTNVKEFSFAAFSDVYFNQLSLQEIDYYIDKYNPFDKAGAYGVQDWIGYIGINKIDGSYYNVMGLPVQLLYKVLCEF